jgi:general secretion pathway protein G
MNTTSAFVINNQAPNNREKGMTLVEIIAVIVLIGLIMGVVAPRIFGQGEAAKAQLNMVRMETIRQALSNYRLQFNKYPDSLQDLVKPSADVKASGKLFTPMVQEKDLEDMWGAPYVYQAKNSNRSYALTTLGSDGVQGGEGPKQDVTMTP